jgi:hypothetical protein
VIEKAGEGPDGLRVNADFASESLSTEGALDAENGDTIIDHSQFVIQQNITYTQSFGVSKACRAGHIYFEYCVYFEYGV